MIHNKKLTIVAWCLYDWACAPFSVVITTFIFATYFTSKVAENSIVGTFQWANATSIAGIIMALVSPLFGAIADYGGNHKRWLLCFTYLSVIFTALLWFTYPAPSSVYYALSCFIVATIGYEVSQVFYNAFLGSLAPESHLGRISGWGWGSGYLGGIAALTLALLFFVKGQPSWLNIKAAEQVRICAPFVALWYAIFSMPFFFLVPRFSERSRPLREAVRIGFIEIMRTIKKLPQEKNILLYLISHMIYTDGLNTLFSFGGIYAAGTFGLSFEEVLLFGITMNITAGIGAILLGWMDDFFGSKATIILSLSCLTVLGIPLLFLQHKYTFWAVALMLGLFVGPVQSASRSLMVRLIAHKNNAGEMFGLYGLSGRITAFIGPWLLGTATLMYGSQRVGMGTVLIFFIVGALLLLPVQLKHLK